MSLLEPLDTKRKALRINLDEHIYGSFAEIGAGQEVARNFFTAGAASGTIAKTMSAYDMAFSNAIYGFEPDGRYVSKSRVLKMLDHEFSLLPERLSDIKYQHKTFFAFANTVSTLNYSKNNDPNAWLGIRFQVSPGSMPNHIMFHVRMLDMDAGLQQRVLGVLGVNLIYGAFFYRDDYRRMIESFVDNISPGSVEIDLIEVSGPDFKDVDNKLLNLYLIAKGYSSATIFTAGGEIYHAKDYLYKKDLLILRTRFLQKSLPENSISQAALAQFKKLEKTDDEHMIFLTELALEKPFTAEDEKTDFTTILNRINELNAEGQIVMVSNFVRHHTLAKYLSRFKPRMVRIMISAKSLSHIFNSEHYGDENYTTELLSYISNLFSQEVQLYVYPEINRQSGISMTLHSIPICPEAQSLFDFLRQNKYLQEIIPETLEIPNKI